MTARRRLSGFLSRFAPDVARTARGVIDRMEQRLPGATRLVYNKKNALVVGFGPNDRATDAVFSIGVYRRWVNLYFLEGAALADANGLLLGSGTRVRFVRLQHADDVEAPDVRALIRQALDNAIPAIPAAPRGRTLVKQDVTER